MGRGEFWLLVLLGPPALCFALLLILFRAYWIPTGSMKPGLIVGDYLLVNRAAYGFPAMMCGLGQCDGDMGPSGLMPARGDVATFVHPGNGKHYIKRVIGLPGDRVQMRDGVLHLNGQAVELAAAGEFEEPYTLEHGYVACKNAPVALGAVCTKDMLRETLPQGPSYLTINITTVAADNGPTFTVEEGHIFVMGDNRDNSLDSRFPSAAGGLGMVPLEDMVGRAEVILFSLTGREGRVLKWVE
jgi:signal peptidase I